MLPEGLIELIKRVIKEDASSIPQSKKGKENKNPWKSFVWYAFLSNNRINADVTYIVNTLEGRPVLEKQWVQAHTRSEWKTDTARYINDELNALRSGRKKGTLEGLLKDLDDPIFTLRGFADWLDKESVNLSYLKAKTKDEKSTKDFIAELTYQPQSGNPNKLYGVGLTKLILWLQYYGMADSFCPPSRQVQDFVDYDVRHLTYLQRKQQQIPGLPMDWGYVLKMQEFHKKEILPTVKTATVRDTGVAVWYWKIVQGLLKGSKYTRLLSSHMLLGYLDSRSLTLPKLVEQIDDIDKIDELTADVKDFLEKASSA